MKLLIVDDEQSVRNGIINSFDWEECNLKVFESSNGCDALEIIKKENINIVLTDIRMPKMNGLELSRKALEYCSTIKIILISGYDDFSYAREALRMGVIEYVLKPVSIEEIVTSVKNAIKLIKQEGKTAQIEKQVDDKKLLLRDRFLNDMILNKVIEKEMIKQLQLFNINLERKLAVCVFQIEEEAEYSNWKGVLGKQLLIFATKNILCELICDSGIVFNDNIDNIVIIHFLGDLSAGELENKIKKYRKILFESLQTTVTVGIGNMCDNPYNIFESYRYALVALEHKFFYGKNEVINFQNIKPTKAQASAPIQIENSLLSAVELCDRYSLEQHLNAYFEYFSQSNVFSEKYIKNSCSAFFMLIIRKLQDMDIDISNLTITKINYEKVLDEIETLDELYNYTREFLVKSLEYVNENYFSQNKKTIISVRKYIENNLDKDLSLEKIAKSVYLSPKYFALIFKNEVNETYSNYIADLRIKKAKLLMKNNNFKIYEIGQKIGYNEQRYFSQFFKKFTGMTPSEYRANLNRSK